MRIGGVNVEAQLRLGALGGRDVGGERGVGVKGRDIPPKSDCEGRVTATK